LSKHGIDLPGRSPYGAAVFFAISALALVCVIYAKTNKINSSADEQNRRTLVCTLQCKRVVERSRLILYDIWPAALSDALGEDKSEPRESFFCINITSI